MQISITDYAALRERGDDHILLDVREPQELATCRLEGSLDIPMMQVPQRVAELPRDRTIVVMCHHGGRSMQVTQFLLGQGFDNVLNLDGGIDQWSVQIDPSLPRY